MHAYVSKERRRLQTKKNPQKEHDSVQRESLRILHVDDDSSFLRVSKLILELENEFKVETATSVNEAFCKLKTQPYDAIVCDYDMPIKNGLDFLKELREQKNLITFVIFTGRGKEEVAIRALNLGADYYINKNSSTEEVYCELANAIRNIAEQKEKWA